ncbi:MAG: hypothetical protein JWM44_2157, partial [Bacilli bacterium]|nr:hypothetical protein [Bacilli bacterium]
KEVEREAMERIRHDSLDAQAWVYLGESLLRQGSGLSAAQIFRRAHLLDPEASWVEAVNREISKSKNGHHRVDVEVLLEQKKVTVAAAILVRNEIRCIERCLRSLTDAVDEIVVIDCESTDGTREVIQSFSKVKFVTFSWIDDFAAARNAGLPHIESDWVIWVDADEVLIPEDVNNIREIAGIFDPIEYPVVLLGGVLEQLGEQTSVNYSKGRMFAMKHRLQFWGRVHEQIGDRDRGVFSEGLTSKPVLIRFNHDGYMPDVMQSKKKLERNLKLLEIMLDEEPENPAWWMFYGRETLGTGDVDKALTVLKEANHVAKRSLAFSRKLEILSLLITIHMSRKELDEAEAYCLEALQYRPDFPDVLFFMAQVQMQKAYQLYHSAELNIRNSKEAFNKYRGSVSPDRNILAWKADLALADIARLVGKPANAKPIYESLLNRHPDKNLIHKRLRQIEEQQKLLNS